jgi:transcriptional regulator with XRE-family HTH domain
MPNLSLGDILRTERKARHWSLDVLAQKSGVHRSSIHEIEMGGNPTLDTVQKLAQALDLPLSALFLPMDAERKRATMNTTDLQNSASGRIRTSRRNVIPDATNPPSAFWSALYALSLSPPFLAEPRDDESTEVEGPPVSTPEAGQLLRAEVLAGLVAFQAHIRRAFENFDRATSRSRQSRHSRAHSGND